jgi:hypothetical protein
MGEDAFFKGRNALQPGRPTMHRSLDLQRSATPRVTAANIIPNASPSVAQIKQRLVSTTLPYPKQK